MNNSRNFNLALLVFLLLIAHMLAAPAARAQSDSTKFELGLNYNYVRANGPPATCACFSMNGGGAWLGYRLTHSFTAVAEFSAQHAGNINSTGEDLTLFSYLFGPRYTWRKSDLFQPFGELLLGGARSSGTFEPNLAGNSGSFNAFAMVAGGGLDLNFSRRIALRAFEADYYFTKFPNGANDHQNNLRVAAGVVIRF